MRVVVVGAGILGASVAWHLAREGAEVVVVDGAGPGGVATPRSWAWINASWGNPAPYVRLRMASMAAWRGLDVPNLAPRWSGGLLWDLAPEEIAAFVAERRAVGYDVRLVDAAEAQRLEPALSRPPEVAAHASSEGSVEPAEAARAFLAAAEAAGARTAFGQAVDGLATRGGRVTGVQVGGGVVGADHVVLAAGAAVPALAATAGVAVLLEAPPGLLVTTEPVPPLLNGLVMAPELHVRQMADGRLLAGTDFGGTDPGEDPEAAAAELMAALRRALRGGNALRLRSFAVGHRPTPADGFPIVGEAAPGLHLCVTHSGLTLAPILGRLVAEEVLTGRRDDLLAPYRPERFAA